MSAPPAVPLLLQARKVTKRFGGLVAVRDVDFDIPQGAIVSLIGPNGAGKTTFFNVIAGLIEPSDGTIDFADVRLVARPTRAWAEPFFWVALPVLAAVIGAGLFLSGATVAGELVAVLAVVLLAASLLVAIVRPAWYVRLLTLAGIFRSARPNDIVDRGIGRTFQNIRLFGQHDGHGERAGGHALAAACVARGRRAPLPAPPRGGGHVAGEGRQVARVRRPAGPRGRAWHATCRTATSGGWRSRGPWPANPSSCCSTSRRPA